MASTRVGHTPADGSDARTPADLANAKVLYLFLDVADVTRQRRFCETVLGLRVVEAQFHPPHEYHGLVKYDAGAMLFALNLVRRPRRPPRSSGLVVVLAAHRARDVLTALEDQGHRVPTRRGTVVTFEDGDGYAYELHPRATGAPLGASDASRVEIVALRLYVADLAASLAFYDERLGLRLVRRGQRTAALATGNVQLLLEQAERRGQPERARRDGYLIVFCTPNIEQTHAALIDRGVTFRAGVGYSDIGGTSRFTDPDGHTLCLYEPSAECLSWGSGAKVRAIMRDQT